MEKFPEDLLRLITYLRKLPGVGLRTAERFAFEILNWPNETLHALGETLHTIQIKVPPCAICGCLSQEGKCSFCTTSLRNKKQLCLVSSPRDVFAIESTQSYQGLYHVVEHLISPLDGRHASTLRIDRIENRIEKNAIEEIIIAFDSTLEGDATALFLKQHLANRTGLQVSRLAFGLPVGSSLEHIDGGTLGRALAGRQIF